MSVRIGVNPITWSNDDLTSLGREISLDECLSQGKAAGYSGFELGHKFPRNSDALATVLAEHDLSLVSGWFSGAVAEITVAEEIKRIQPHLELLKSCGATVMVYCDTTGAIHCDFDQPLSHRPVLSVAQWAAFCDRLNEVAHYCYNQGVQLAYHHHMGSIVQTSEEIERLMDGTDDVLGLLLDTGHLTYAGGDPVAILQKYVHRVCHVHCKDIRPTMMADAHNRNLSFLQAVLNGVFTVPGDGCVDYPSVFSLLAEAKYSGWLVVEAEQDPCVAPPLKYAAMGAEYLRDQCKTHNL